MYKHISSGRVISDFAFAQLFHTKKQEYKHIKEDTQANEESLVNTTLIGEYDPIDSDESSIFISNQETESAPEPDFGGGDTGGGGAGGDF